jgi:hypothetical protein
MRGFSSIYMPKGLQLSISLTTLNRVGLQLETD